MRASRGDALAPKARRRAIRRQRPRMQRRPAVFVDRDGTLNREVHYLAKVEGLHLLPGVAAAIHCLAAAGFAVVVVTNQSGVARGLMTLDAVDAIHRELMRRLARGGVVVDAIYFCPHHPTEGRAPLRRRCRCRKPRPGLVHRAARELALDLGRSYCVGDGAVDLELAAAVGARGVLVLTGHGRATRRSLDARLPVAHVAVNFRAAAKWIIDDAERSARHRRR
jgi:D-glycero-D-manno-heptose 1,7-bisphosphate phosphatase